MKTKNIQIYGLFLILLVSTLANGINYARIYNDIFASWIALIPLLIGYIVYALYVGIEQKSQNDRSVKDANK